MKNSIDLITFFQSIKLFSKLPLNVIKKMTDLAQIKKKPLKEIIHNVDDTITEFNFIYKGFAKSYITLTNGNEHNYDFFSEFDALEISDFIFQSQSQYNIISLTPVILITLPIQILDILTQNKQFLKNVIIHHKNKAENKQYLLNALFSKYRARQATLYIIYFLSQKTGIRDEKDMIIKNILSHQELALFIGITGKSFRDNLKKITAEKIIKSIGNGREKKDFVIKNYDAFVEKHIKRVVSN